MSVQRQELCKVDGDNGESTWSRNYTRWTCTHWKGHKGKHSWEAEGRYLA